MTEDNIHKKVQFGTIVKLFEKLSKTKLLRQKEVAFKHYIEKFNEYKQKFLNDNPGASAGFFSILRLILVKLDRERDSYGLKEVALGKLLIKVLAIDDTGSDGQLLKTAQSGDNHGDYGDIVYRVMVNRCRKDESDVTVYDVNNCLDKLALGNRQAMDKALSDIFNRFNPEEAKWFTRIILKDIKIGLGQANIFNCLHPKANDLYQRLSSLVEICDRLENGQLDVDEVQVDVKLFVPFKPQLCTRFNYQNLDGLLREREYFVETKMDGERQQLHRQGERYQYFTRQGFNASQWFGETPKTGKLTPFIHNLFKIKVTDLIMDGEMMVWHKTEHRYVVKGENVEVRKFKTDTYHRVCFCVYDLLQLNGVSLLQKPYIERVRLLSTLFDDHEGILVKVKRDKARTSTAILSHLNKAIDDHEEGIVIKAVDSVYAPGQRGNGWYKIKPDYIDNLISDLDLIVLGVTFKRGKTTIENFVVGIKDGPKYLAVGSVTNGLTNDEFSRVYGFLQKTWRPIETVKDGRRTRAKHARIDFGCEVPDKVIEPENSTIFTILASELQRSSQYATEYTLRFPRITTWREDKSAEDCCTLEEFRSLCEGGGKGIKKLTKRHVTAEDLHGEPVKKKSTKTSPNKYAETTSIEVLDNILDGKDICVINALRKVTKDELEMRIKKHGGRPVACPAKNTFICIAENQTLLVKKIMEDRSCTIVGVDWALKALPDCVMEKLLPIRPNDVLVSTLDLEEEFIMTYDEFGDHLTEEWDLDELKVILTRMKVERLTNIELQCIESEIIHRPFNVFRNVKACFKTDTPLKLEFISRGGTLTAEDTAEFVIVDRLHGDASCNEILSQDFRSKFIF